MAQLGELFLAFARLDRKRTDRGLSVRELERWSELRELLNRRFSSGMRELHLDKRQSVRVPTRLNASFENLGKFQRSLITKLSRRGVFINTASPLEIGTRLRLRIHIERTGEDLEVPGVVVTNHVGPGFDTQQLGMGIRFSDLEPETVKQLDDLYEATIRSEAQEGNL